MTDLEILKFLQQEIHSVVMAVTDENGLPCTTVTDVMLAEESGLYVLVSQGNRIYRRLKENPWISITGILGKTTTALQSVTLKGQIKNLGKSRMDEIFEKNPYMQAIYPEAKSRRVLEVFCVYERRRGVSGGKGSEPETGKFFLWRRRNPPERLPHKRETLYWMSGMQKRLSGILYQQYLSQSDRSKQVYPLRQLYENLSAQGSRSC